MPIKVKRGGTSCWSKELAKNGDALPLSTIYDIDFKNDRSCPIDPGRDSSRLGRVHRFGLFHATFHAINLPRKRSIFQHLKFSLGVSKLIFFFLLSTFFFQLFSKSIYSHRRIDRFPVTNSKYSCKYFLKYRLDRSIPIPSAFDRVLISYRKWHDNTRLLSTIIHRQQLNKLRCIRFESNFKKSSTFKHTFLLLLFVTSIS